MYLGKHITCKAQGKGVKFGSEDGVVEDCAFPFIYKGKKYNGCSKDVKGKWWCATKVDSRGNMIADKWARCNEYCATDDGNLCIFLEIVAINFTYISLFVVCTITFMQILGTHQTCKANGQGNDYIKKGDAKDCEFPFIHKNKKYIGCATSEDLKVHYCATKLDSKGNMVEWARCNKFCKTDAERKCSVFIIIKFSLYS